MTSNKILSPYCRYSKN